MPKIYKHPKFGLNIHPMVPGKLWTLYSSYSNGNSRDISTMTARQILHDLATDNINLDTASVHIRFLNSPSCYGNTHVNSRAIAEVYITTDQRTIQTLANRTYLKPSRQPVTNLSGCGQTA